MVNQSETSVISYVDNRSSRRLADQLIKNLQSKCVKIFEILKVNLRIFYFEYDLCMTELLTFKNMAIWAEIEEGFIGF